MMIDRFVSAIKNKELKSEIGEYVLVNIQNAVDYFLKCREEEVTYFYKEFQKCFSPWDKCILSFKYPDYTYSKEMGVSITPKKLKGREFVILCRATNNDKRKDLLITYFVETDYGFKDMGGSYHTFDSKLNIVPEYNEDGGHLIKVLVDVNDEDFLEMKEFITAILAPSALYAFTFCNCRNVVKKQNNYPINLIKRRKRENKFPITRFYTLEIDGKTRSNASKNNGEWKNSLHICRGHFKNYTEESPLFGFYVGTVWCPQHLKGHEDIGVVKKDYSIK